MVKMMVANSFDLWQKDAFFSAAEEVQESADRMESAYRTWLRGRRGVTPELLDELCRELQTALGTAKWQLEEFDKAVRLSYGSHCNDNSTTRHRDFVAAIENQISLVEASLKEFFHDEAKQPMRWVNLDEEERDDLALFLSGGSGDSQTTEDACVNDALSEGSFVRENHYKTKNSELSSNTTCNRDILHERKGSKDVVTINNDAKYVIELEAKEVVETRDDINCQTDRASASRRTWNSPNFGDWKIVIADCDEQMKKSVLGIDATLKENDSKPVSWKQRCGELLKSKGGSPSYTHLRGNSWINQNFGRLGWFHRQPRSPRHLQFRCSVQVTLALMLSIFLIVPFVLYSR